MKSNIPSVLLPFCGGWLRFWLRPLSLLLLCGSAWADCEGTHDIPLTCASSPDCSYAVTPSTAISTPEQIKVSGAGGNVWWVLTPSYNCSGSPTSITCLGMNVNTPPIDPVSGAVSTQPVTLSGTSQAPLAESYFVLTVTDAADPLKTCSRNYNPRVTSTGGGWGDPHITTVDGVHYDFQSAGEFVALRGYGMEIQTRQTPVPTAYIPGANAYTGLAGCVSIYTAIAVKVGNHRVSYQQSSTDPKIMELRVDGVLKTLGAEGINLAAAPLSALHSVDVVTPKLGTRIAKPMEEVNLEPKVRPIHPSATALPPKIGGRIVKSATGDGIEIHYTNGTRVVVTQSWWEPQQKWYLNVDVYETTATEGVMGRIAQGSWLPALADGSSVGPKANAVSERYTQLYKTFADSWRVTNANSLFYYAPGTSTQTFTLADWPRENPTTCAIGNQMAVQPVVQAAVAQAQCKTLVDENAKADCIFDVMATGHTGFANTYLIQQKLRGVTSIRQRAIEKIIRAGERVTFIVPKGLSPRTSLVQFVVDGKNFGAPVRLDATGQAVFSSSNLPAGKHRIEMKFIKASVRGISTEINRAVVPVQPNMK